MKTVTLDLPTNLITSIEREAIKTGQPLEAVITDILAARFAQSGVSTTTGSNESRIRLRPIALTNGQADTTFRREDLYGDDAR